MTMKKILTIVGLIIFGSVCLYFAQVAAYRATHVSANYPP
jgi:hypothetical protein